MKASIIVSIDANPVLVENYICNLDKYPTITDYDVVFTNDGGHETAISKLLVEKNFNHKYQYIPNESKQGYGVVNNNAVKYALSDTLIFMNSDVILNSRCLEIMLSELESPDVDAVQPLLIYPQTGLVQSTGHVFSKNYNTHLFENRRTEDDIVQIKGERQSFTTALCCMRRDVFNAYGGFDSFYFNAWEGMELGLRIHHDGGRILYTPEARAYHIRGGGRGIYSIDERPQSAEFWSRWREKIVPDIYNYLKMQLDKINLLSSEYILLNFSSIRDISHITDHLDLDISKTIYFTEYSGLSNIEFFKTIPYYWIVIKRPLIIFANNFTSIKNNYYWLESRGNKYDLAMDLSGNCDLCSSFYHNLGSK